MKSLPVTLLASVVLFVSPAQAQDDSSANNKAETGSCFLDPGEWWNLYFDESNDPTLKKDPLKRSINAVKIIQVSQTHPNWVQIAFPKERKEHFSIFGPAAKAHRNPSINFQAALAEWERSISEWKSIWINLYFVVHMSKVEPAHAEEPTAGPKSDRESFTPSGGAGPLYAQNPQRKDEGSTSAARPQSDAQRSRADIPSTNDALSVYRNNRKAREAEQLELAGSWQLLLPAGVRREVTLVAAGTDKFVLKPDNLVWAGRYRVVDGFLISVGSSKDDPTAESYSWRVRSPFMLVLEKQTGMATDYTSTTLFRERGTDDDKTDSGLPREKWQGPQWEYRLLQGHLEQAYNELGRNGWRLQATEGGAAIFERRRSGR